MELVKHGPIGGITHTTRTIVTTRCILQHQVQTLAVFPLPVLQKTGTFLVESGSRRSKHGAGFPQSSTSWGNLRNHYILKSARPRFTRNQMLGP